jgi:Ca-activated chloride channel family protein
MFDLKLEWDRAARTGTQPTSHTLRVRICPENRVSLGAGVPVMLAVALDISGSMAGDKLYRSKRACEAIISLLRTQDRLWFAGFSTSLEPVAADLPGGSGAAELVRSKIKKLTAQGVTRTDVALQWIESSLKDVPGAMRIGILITDGNPTDPLGKQDIDPSPLLGMAGRLGQAGVSICAVGLGNANAYNSALLTQLSDHGRGEFIYAETPEQLEKLLAARLSASQTVAASSGVLEIERLMAGSSITSACRFRPEYLPLEPVENEKGFHVELGPIRSDVHTDILLNVEVPAPPDDSWSGAADIFSVKLMGSQALSSVPAAQACLTNTVSYSEAQRQNADVEKDRLNWDVNQYSDALVKVRQQIAPDTAKMRKTGQLLAGMEQSARRAGNDDLANEVSAQVTELRKTGRLDAHRATGLLTVSRQLGTGRSTVAAEDNE